MRRSADHCAQGRVDLAANPKRGSGHANRGHDVVGVIAHGSRDAENAGFALFVFDRQPRRRHAIELFPHDGLGARSPSRRSV